SNGVHKLQYIGSEYIHSAEADLTAAELCLQLTRAAICLQKWGGAEAASANWKVLKITCPWFVVHVFIFAAQAWSVELVYFLEGKGVPLDSHSERLRFGRSGMEYMDGLHNM
ncbi:hypothetical protein FOZ63_028730, partial [Perkinsus olseni]